MNIIAFLSNETMYHGQKVKNHKIKACLYNFIQFYANVLRNRVTRFLLA